MEFVSTQANTTKRFEQGLRPLIREKLVALKIRDYRDSGSSSTRGKGYKGQPATIELGKGRSDPGWCRQQWS